MAEVAIQLQNSDKVAAVSPEDFEMVSQYKWALHRGAAGHVYAAARIGGKCVLMHRLILQPPDGLVVDHIDNNGLNNTRANIRICTYTQNMQNRPMHRNNKLGVKGVYQDKRSKLYLAQLKINGQRKIIGWFRSLEEAGAAYRDAAKEVHGEFFHQG